MTTRRITPLGRTVAYSLAIAVSLFLWNIAWVAGAAIFGYPAQPVGAIIGIGWLLALIVAVVAFAWGAWDAFMRTLMDYVRPRPRPTTPFPPAEAAWLEANGMPLAAYIIRNGETYGAVSATIARPRVCRRCGTTSPHVIDGSCDLCRERYRWDRGYDARRHANRIL